MTKFNYILFDFSERKQAEIKRMTSIEAEKHNLGFRIVDSSLMYVLEVPKLRNQDLLEDLDKTE